jgi:hypothetical protein
VNQLIPIAAPALPPLVTAAGEHNSMRFLEFFAAHIRNPHTRWRIIGQPRNSWSGAQALACCRSPPCSRCMLALS